MNRYFARKPKSRASKFALIVVFVLIAALVTSVFYIRAHYYENLKPVSESQTTKLVTVELGQTAREIAATLKEAGLIKETWAFEWYVRNNNLRDKLQAGSLHVQARTSRRSFLF